MKESETESAIIFESQVKETQSCVRASVLFIEGDNRQRKRHHTEIIL